MTRWKLYWLFLGWKTCAFATLSTGCLTLYLFLATSKCEPLECTTWAELACLPPWLNRGLLSQSLPKPEFCCFSECGRYYAVTQPQIENGKIQKEKLAIFETVTKARVGLVDVQHSDLTDFCISGDGKFLALIWGCVDLQVCRWPSLELLHKRVDLSPFAATSMQPLPDSQTVLMSTSANSSFWDLGTGMRLDDHPGKAFVQPDADVKALNDYHGGAMAVWRVKDQAPIWQLDDATYQAVRRHFYCLHNQSRLVRDLCEPVASPDGTLLAEFTTRPGIVVRSVDAGEILPTGPTIQGDFFGPRFTRDNRFMAFF